MKLENILAVTYIRCRVGLIIRMLQVVSSSTYPQLKVKEHTGNSQNGDIFFIYHELSVSFLLSSV